MTENVDNSSAVLLCVTKAYKDSLNCNREASYADSRRKIIIPLKLDRNIELDGWLESIVEGKRCYEFYDSKSVKETVSELDKELISLGVQKNRDISSANIGQPLDTLRVDEVCSWLKGIEIDSAIIETFRENCVSGDDLTQITYDELIGEDFELRPLDAGKIIKKRDACFNATQSNAVTPDGRPLRAGTGRAGASKGKSAQAI
ncbi:uncharacterized protein [Ptychodera flava]|uniref:uncharacterized protein n=1 Tax=Ptychodera flava TaxID=63121 RepID=UPI00396A505F